MPASNDPDPIPVQRGRMLAGVLLLAAWLGWSLAALWAQADASQPPAGRWRAADVLAQLSPAVLAASHQHPLLLRQSIVCGCAPPARTPDGIDLREARTPLPFEWLVLYQQRLVYAGPSLLDAGCGGRPLAAAPLVAGLLRNAQAPVILSHHCPCHKE
ncbi:hypothetical protein [Stenotrophomonas maltophilia]|uniref:hypothetical protein n=1 Tax=Stenotrophomonas maltophilia TaxID=40324 RepID=UPI0039C31122